MYTVKPLGINTKENDREIKDGYLKESINLQWRDGSFRPTPERLLSGIDVNLYPKIILHKVSDEDRINVLGFSNVDNNFLASTLSYFLGGEVNGTGTLNWIGVIENGFYTAKSTPEVIPITNTSGMSFTILNGLIYFMGDGSEPNEEYYIRLQYEEINETYVTKDMYAWKTLVPFYPTQDDVKLTAPNKTYNTLIQCGLILTRFSLVLNSGEEVLHTPIYCSYMQGLNRSDEEIKEGSLIENIHTFINMNLEFSNNTLLESEISAINVYCTVPYYETKVPLYGYAPGYFVLDIVNNETARGEAQRLAETPFYLVKTITKPTNEKLLLTVGDFDSDISVNLDDGFSKVGIDTIAAGSNMPVDNFTYHKLFGRITSYNGLLIIDKPRTVLSGGSMRALSLLNNECNVGFKIDTEDGTLGGLGYVEDKSVAIFDLNLFKGIVSRGILSYPDSRANYVGGNSSISSKMTLITSRANKAHNMSCVFDLLQALPAIPTFGVDPDDSSKLRVLCSYYSTVAYAETPNEDVNTNLIDISYLSENRIQFSEFGEYSVFPASSSYRVGEGKIMKVGSNNIDPTNADVVAPLFVGTTDGLYTVNLDPTGTNLISSITRSAKTPYISEEAIQIEGSVIYVSDRGLMVFGGSTPVNLTEDFFPEQGGGDNVNNETVLPNYNLLTTGYFGGSGNIYILDDIVNYLKDSIFAFDSRRKILWCSNPNKNFSLLYSFKNKMWSMNTTVFTEVVDFFSISQTEAGDVYSWHMIREKSISQTELLVLSGEDMEQEVDYHMLTRPIKMRHPDDYKKIRRMFSRCELFRINGDGGFFSFGVWGKQDQNSSKVNIPIVAITDDSIDSFPDDIRQDIPIGARKGKYKTITILQGGRALPYSSIDGIDFDALLVDNKRKR